MDRIEAIELIQVWFTQTAYEQVRQTRADQIEDDEDALPFAWELLYKACDKFEDAITLGKSKKEALIEAEIVFTLKSVLS